MGKLGRARRDARRHPAWAMAFTAPAARPGLPSFPSSSSPSSSSRTTAASSPSTPSTPSTPRTAQFIATWRPTVTGRFDPRPRRLPARYRCRLTNEPLSAGTARALWSDEDHTRPESIRRPIPLRLHRTETEDGPDPSEAGYADRANVPQGLEWTRETQRYFRDALPRWRLEEEGAYDWWDVPVILSRMLARDKAGTELALAIDRDGVDVADWCREHRWSLYGVNRRLRLVRLMVQQYFIPRLHHARRERERERVAVREAARAATMTDDTAHAMAAAVGE